MKHLKTFQELNEDITIPVNIGDTIYQGKFKNKKTVIKEIGEDGNEVIRRHLEHGMKGLRSYQ